MKFSTSVAGKALLFFVTFLFVCCVEFSHAEELWTGKLGLHWIDDFHSELTLTTLDGITFVLKGIAGIPPAYGSEVQVAGELSANLIINVSSLHLTPKPLKSIGKHRAAVMITQFNDGTPIPNSAAIKDVFSSLLNTKLKSWFEEESHGRFSITFDIYGIHSYKATGADCAAAMSETSPLNVAHALNVPIDQYDHIMLFSEKLAGCRLETSTAQGDKTSLYALAYQDLAQKLWAVAHELLHNLGLGHGGLSECLDESGNYAILDGICAHSEYGDWYTVMSGSAGGHLIHLTTWERYALGWLDTHNIIDVASSGVYELQPSELFQTRASALRLQGRSFPYSVTGAAASYQKHDYWVEFRQPIGQAETEAFTIPSSLESVMVRLNPKFLRSQLPNPFVDDMISFTYPGTSPGSFTDTLRIGRLFRDPQSNFTLTPLAINGSPSRPDERRMEVGVCFDGDPCSSVIAAPAIRFTKSKVTIRKGRKIRKIVPRNSGGSVMYCAIEPALPATLMFDPVSCVVSGSANNTSPSTRYTVRSANMAGASTATFDLRVVR